MSPTFDMALDGDNILAAALRYGVRQAAIEHQAEHRQPIEGCDGCQIMRAAAALKTTQADDDARWGPMP